MMSGREWAWMPGLGEPVEVLARTELWGRAVAEVVVTSTQRRLRVDAKDLAALSTRRWAKAELMWRSAATRALALAAEGEPLVGARGGVGDS